MDFNLTNIKKVLGDFRFILVSAFFIFFFLIVVIFQQINKPQPPQAPITTTPPSLKEQPIVNGRLNENAAISQRAKKAIETLTPNLPYNNTIRTSTGQNVLFTIFAKPNNTHFLFIAIDNINFRSAYGDPDLPKNVQNFRETTDSIFSWMKSYNANPGDVFISWDDNAYIQNSAEAWLTESPQFPKVIKQGDNFVFEKTPVQ